MVRMINVKLILEPRNSGLSIKEIARNHHIKLREKSRQIRKNNPDRLSYLNILF